MLKLLLALVVREERPEAGAVTARLLASAMGPMAPPV